MARAVFARGVAIGAACGLVAGLGTVLTTPDLPAAPWSALRMGSVIASVYVLAACAAVLVLGGLGGALSRLGLPGERLTAGPTLWGLTLGLVGLAIINESARRVDWIEAWKDVLRGALLLCALTVLARGVLFPPGERTRVARWAEGGLCVLGALALAGAGAYFATPMPEAAALRAEAESRVPAFASDAPAAVAAVSPQRPRVLVLGLDGAAWDRIDAGIAEGRLPTFARLVAGGIRAPLQTLQPTYSPVIWTTVATGARPAEHGITDFYLTQVPRLGLERVRLPRAADLAEEALDGTGELVRVPVTSSLRQRKAIWNLADEAGLASAVLGLWATWPPERLEHGFVVSDHAPQARRQEWLDRRKLSENGTELLTTHPPELAARLEPFQRSPDSVTREELEQFVLVDDALWQRFEAVRRFDKGRPLSAFRSTHLNDSFFLQSAYELWTDEDLDLMFVYLKAIDELCHFFYDAGVPEARALGWSEQEARAFGGVVDRAYEWTDALIAPLVDAVDADPNTLLIVVSDHGWEREPDGSYDHNYAPPGILLLYGAGLCRGSCPPLREPSVYDVAPTVIERLGLPLSEELPGRPLQEAFARPNPLLEVARYGAPQHQVGVVASEIDEELRRKLEALGYLD